MLLLLILLFFLELYLFMKMSSYIDREVYWKYRLLGPFALLVPGVLKPGGGRYVLATAVGAIVLFSLGLYVFEMGDLVLG